MAKSLKQAYDYWQNQPDLNWKRIRARRHAYGSFVLMIVCCCIYIYGACVWDAPASEERESRHRSTPAMAYCTHANLTPPHCAPPGTHTRPYVNVTHRTRTAPLSPHPDKTPHSQQQRAWRAAGEKISGGEECRRVHVRRFSSGGR